MPDLTDDQRRQADQDRRASLASASMEQDCVFIEVLYRGRWVLFDISAMEVKYLPLATVVERHFQQAFKDLALPLFEASSEAAESSSSETSVVS